MPDRSVAAEATTHAVPRPIRQSYITLKDAATRGRLRAWAQPVTYLGLAMLVTIYGFLAFLIVGDRNEATAAAKRQGGNLVRVIDKSYSNFFQAIDSALLFIIKAYQQNPDTFNLVDWAASSSIQNDITFNYIIADASGSVVKATHRHSDLFLKSVIGLNVRDRDYFQHHLKSSSDDLHIGKPIVLAISKTKAIVLSRRMMNADGSFAGIVVALVDPMTLARTVANLDLGRGGTFGLFGLDGVVHSRVVDGVIDAQAIGKQFQSGNGLLTRVANERTGNFWNTPGLFDDVRRMVSYRVLENFPVIATLTATETAIYRHVDKAARIYWSIALLLTLAILFAVRLGVARERKLLAATSDRTRAQEALRQSQERYALVEEAVNDGIWDWNILTDQDYRSPRWNGILGFDDDELGGSGSSFRELIHPDDKARVAEAVRAHLNDGAPYNLEFRLRHKDGSYRWVHSRGKAIRDADNRLVRMVGSMTDISQRKTDEAAAEESRANLARAEAMVHMGHFKYDIATGNYLWSDGLYRLMGMSKDTFRPSFDNTMQLVHPDDRARLQRYRDDVLAGLEMPPVTTRAIKGDGSILHIEIWPAATRGGDGAVTGMFGTSRDVTAHMSAEEAIEQSRDLFARAEALAYLGHYKFEKGSNKVSWSAGTYRIMGKPADYMPTIDGVLELFHPDDRPVLKQYREDIMAGEKPEVLTLRVLKDDGSVAIVETLASPMRAADGSVIGLFGAVQDVTARKQTQALVEESLANLERAERLALLGHFKIDRDTGELTWSEGIFRIFGLSSAEFTPTLRGALELIHPDDRHLLGRYRDEAMAGREVPHATLRAIRSDGRTIEIEYWSTPVRDADGVITGVFGTVQDITLRKRAEAALERANQELEVRVSERTAELANEMKRREEAQMTLAQMQKMEVVGQLTAGIAHDFNNLLAVIGGSLEFVDGAAARGLTAEPELIDAALRATRRGRELVKRLLAFARQSPLRAEATAIDQLVLDTLRLLQRTLGQGIDMVTHLDAKAAIISVDRNQMANALLNLALNARDAMPEGGQLTISTACRPVTSNADKSSSRWPTGEAVCITISDTGLGMPDEVRKRAFEPFFTTKADGLGSGLGLSMVQGFVEQSGGQIEIDSGEGRGTAITIKLPRIVSVSQDDEADAAGGMSASGREKTVLLVEDDPDVRVVTAAQLKQLGYKVHSVANGMEAIDLIASPATIDITLTDIVLPGGLDGVGLIKEAMRARPKMGVLCMSGYDPAQKHRKWLKIQNIIFLEKPFSSSRLAQALADALAH